MAKLQTNVMGNLIGRVGNVIARTVDGGTAFSARPLKHEPSQSEAAVNARSRFKVVSKLAGSILSLPDLKSIWDKLRTKGKSSRSIVIKQNYHYTGIDKPTKNNILAPDGFVLPFQSLTLNTASLDFELNALNLSADFSPVEVDLGFSCLIVCHNPVNPENLDNYKIIELSQDAPGYNFTASFTGSLPLNLTLQETITKYQNNIVLIAAVSKNTAGEIIQNSSTYSSETA